MKRSTILKLVVILTLLAGAGIFCLTISIQRAKIESLEKRITSLKSDTVPLKFMILSRSDEEVSARIKLYDTDGNEIAKIEKAWAGRELYLDFLVIPASGRYIAFPWKVFTDKTSPNAGTMLPGYYDEGGFPGVFRSHSMDPGIKEALSVLFRKAMNGETLQGGFGSAVHDVRQVAQFDVGVVYRVITRLSGGVEIVVD